MLFKKNKIKTRKMIHGVWPLACFVLPSNTAELNYSHRQMIWVL